MREWQTVSPEAELSTIMKDKQIKEAITDEEDHLEKMERIRDREESILGKLVKVKVEGIKGGHS